MLRIKTLLLVPVLALYIAGCGGGAPAQTGIAGGGADMTQPTAPSSLIAGVAGSSAVNLSWNASSDNVGVTGYRVERCQGAGCGNFSQIAAPANTSHSDSGLAAATTFRYRVRATDAAGNLGPYSTTANATTASASGDTTPPTTPGGLLATAIGEARIDLLWSASSDDVGVTGYRLERCAGVGCTTNFAQISTPSALTYSDTSFLLPSSTYGYRVRATDAAGNLSGFSLISYATTLAATGTTLPLGALAHDGPATPEQISLILPVTGGVLPQSATASVRYKPTSSSTWITGHPLHRIRPAFSVSPAVGSVPDAFAWPIIDLMPGTSYDVEVAVTSGATTEVKSLTHVTRALPAAAGPITMTIPAGSTGAQVQSAFNALTNGQGAVVQLENGTYTVNNLVLNRSGSVNNPIYIRGASRAGVVLSDSDGVVLQLQNASHVVIENLTIQGSGVDSGTSTSSRGIEFSSASPTQTRATVRNVIMNGVDSAIVASAEIREFLAYDNTLNGNNQWTASFIDTNITWNDDGVRIPGFGNCAFNNTLRGFGDTLSYAMHSGDSTLTQAIGVHFYRNDVLMGGDDLAEADHSHRNNTLYDNRSGNTMTLLSLDPLYGGPFVAIRNISINTGRGPFKFNNQNTGHFIYNNTIARTNGSTGWGWNQSNNGSQQAWGFRNNVFVYRGTNGLMAFEPGGNTTIDFTHNSWFPNSSVWWSNSGGSFSSIANAYLNLPATTSVFSGLTKRHEQDNITTSNPWTVAITLGADYHTEVQSNHIPALAAGAPKNSGAVIPNVTDGFSGAAPDRGAIIEGRPVPQYGDRTP